MLSVLADCFDLYFSPFGNRLTSVGHPNTLIHRRCKSGGCPLIASYGVISSLNFFGSSQEMTPAYTQAAPHIDGGRCGAEKSIPRAIFANSRFATSTRPSSSGVPCEVGCRSMFHSAHISPTSPLFTISESLARITLICHCNAATSKMKRRKISGNWIQMIVTINQSLILRPNCQNFD